MVVRLGDVHKHARKHCGCMLDTLCTGDC
uniref:Uncharacterized protein n=1 Tax=Arundo donax TaxID=35708 RepID=A0A0A8YN15_ARUDO